ncbi:MAG: hypothetical protein KC983_00605 [Phycisphaerales bacterium]|nr:hypothetical protein [Phycisphaerales bacterium]
MRQTSIDQPVRRTPSRAALGLFVLVAALFTAGRALAQEFVPPVSADEESWVAVVTADDVYLRSGASKSYYHFGKVKQGDLVLVTGKKFKWARIAAVGPVFQDLFGLIKFKVDETGRLQMQPDGKTAILTGRTEVQAPNLASSDPLKGVWKAIDYLPAKTEIEIVETVQSDLEVFHKIRLPETAVAWISENYLRPATAAEIATWETSLAQARMTPAERNAAQAKANAAQKAVAEKVESVKATVEDAVTPPTKPAAPTTTAALPPKPKQGSPAETTIPAPVTAAITEANESLEAATEAIQNAVDDLDQYSDDELDDTMTMTSERPVVTPDSAGTAGSTTSHFDDSGYVTPVSTYADGYLPPISDAPAASTSNAASEKATPAGNATEAASTGEQFTIEENVTPVEIVPPAMTTTDGHFAEQPAHWDDVTTPPAASGGAPTAPANLNLQRPQLPPLDSEFTVQDLEKRFLLLQDEPTETAELAPLRSLYYALADREGHDTNVGRYALARVEQLRIWGDLQQRNQELRLLRSQFESTSRDVEAIRLAVSREGEYTAVGRLTSSTIYDGTELPRLLRIQDPTTGRTVAYIRPDASESIDLHTLIGQIIGVAGPKQYDGGLRLNLVDPVRIDVLSPGN